MRVEDGRIGRPMTPVSAQPVCLPNRHGATIRGLLHRVRSPRGEPERLVIACAGLGMPLRRTQLPALHLAANGMSVLRYDPTNSGGRSDGGIADFTLTRSLEDLVDVLRWAEDELRVRRVGLFAASLGGRVALRAAAREPERIAVVATVSCVVDVRRSLHRAAGQDYVGDWIAGRLPDPAELRPVLRNDIRVDCAADIVAGDWSDRGGTAADVAACRADLLDVHGAHDPWVDTAEVVDVLGRRAGSRVVVLDDAVHELNLVTARAALGEVVRMIHATLRPAEAIGAWSPTVPGFAELVALNKAERAIERQLTPDARGVPVPGGGGQQ
jgi:pimeloyl-ACP methyl ester carboxylesterase